MAKKIIKFNNRLIGENQPVFMIAEIGINHNGDMQIAKKLIDAAFATNWDCVKFQKRTPELCVPEHQKNVMRDTPWGRMPYLEYRYHVEFEKKQYDYIDTYCREKPIAWTSSIWDLKSLEFLLQYDIPFIKIPSAKLTEHEFIVESAKSGKPVILSTGMSTTEEIDTAVEVLEKHTKGNYAIMHTNSVYPAPQEDLNLRVIHFLKERYKCIVGYSGHEYEVEPTVIAASLGVSMIERHVTIDHTMWGSDQFASLEVHAMDMLRKRIKDVDVVLGDGIKKLTNKELEVRKKLRGY
ncbi:MAG: N-acetylneuraminate synthase [Omnitrophica bacterium RIFCSPLOWO2_12_FULL_44_17]|uniref:N-acetylneuraminate synthase n=1 Tax=Candidatus Danuiimicrobium aquiferis TaxID=1801832 RepID=A0A1G1KTZ9_9BACT|nr:MAG: N-acetylneuraminate synthase [Omnitrophica bacterium RIFCSPHIGHO2_02_FULL_45_28]OGW96325.1 MAG: N-acetylneuraminate synthase [Omnitrophica bacterium RIFCSPLOWO2_12_FULL_44_17]OGX04243.1 MAG: N-acetylneuraminate synthase [Omnitrophica bacterium RIFCSPLOWO2_02_FULL_44_11]